LPRPLTWPYVTKRRVLLALFVAFVTVFLAGLVVGF